MGRGHWVVLVETVREWAGQFAKDTADQRQDVPLCFMSHPLWPTVPPRVLLLLVGIQSKTGSAPSRILQTFVRPSHYWTARADVWWDLILLANSDSQKGFPMVHRRTEPSVCQRKCEQPDTDTKENSVHGPGY